MTRKVYVDVTVRLIINLDDGVAVDEAVSELDYHFNLPDGGEVVDSEITDYAVKDSK